MTKMSDILDEIQNRINKNLYGSEAWGSRDLKRLKEIENLIGHNLPKLLKDLSLKYGNLTFPPFQVDLLGADNGPISAIAHTGDVREFWTALPKNWLVIGQSGSNLFVLNDNDSISMYDQDANPNNPPEVKRFQTILDFISYILFESKSIQEEPGGFF